jgi:hypothetical protein
MAAPVGITIWSDSEITAADQHRALSTEAFFSTNAKAAFQLVSCDLARVEVKEMDAITTTMARQHSNRSVRESIRLATSAHESAIPGTATS